MRLSLNTTSSQLVLVKTSDWSLIGAKRETHLDIECRVGSLRGHMKRATYDAGPRRGRGGAFRDLNNPRQLISFFFKFLSYTVLHLS